MSQAKVDRYKEQKANRKAIVEKERKQRKMAKAAWILALVVVLGGVGTGVGLTIRNNILKAEAAKPDYTTDSFVLTDYSGILETEAAETEAAETQAAQ